MDSMEKIVNDAAMQVDGRRSGYPADTTAASAAGTDGKHDHESEGVRGVTTIIMQALARCDELEDILSVNGDDHGLNLTRSTRKDLELMLDRIHRLGTLSDAGILSIRNGVIINEMKTSAVSILDQVNDVCNVVSSSSHDRLAESKRLETAREDLGHLAVRYTNVAAIG
jgi:hypothetical protein